MIRIEITGEIQKESGEKFTKEQIENINNDLIEWIESKGCVFIGITTPS